MALDSLMSRCQMTINEFRTQSPIVACAVGAAAGVLGLTLLIAASSRVFAVLLLLFAGWVIVSSIVQSMVRISEEGVSFMTIRGRQQWLWTEITEVHLSGTGTIPGIAVYRGSAFLSLGRSQFRELGAVARYIEARGFSGHCSKFLGGWLTRGVRLRRAG
jgi:hypothetical protein